MIITSTELKVELRKFVMDWTFFLLIIFPMAILYAFASGFVLYCVAIQFQVGGTGGD